MSRQPQHDILFEPVRIGPKTLRNRFYQSPHSNGFGSDQPGAQAAYRGLRAEGGWAGVCLELCSIHPETDRVAPPCVRLWDEDDARNLAFVCEAIHAHGALAGLELWHGGPHNLDGATSREVPGAPTQLPSELFPLSYPRELDRSGIRELQALYVRAADRARAAGFDIVYVYGAHGYLPLQFLSPFYNKRTDEYGGSLENRARFWLETLELVRERVGDDCAIAARLAVASVDGPGLELDEGLGFVGLADHLVDLWDVNVSAIAAPWVDMAPSRLAPEGNQLEWTAAVRGATRKPIVGVGRYTSPDAMADVVRSGVWNLIGAARPAIADPFLPLKLEQGRYDDVRECIGCNFCVSRVFKAGHVACTQNATAGEEYRRGWHPERFPRAANADRDVLVVGAGAAGMECALVLARRGLRRVHLVDRAPEVGGYVAAVSRLPGLGEWKRVVDHRVVQLRKCRNVEVIAGVALDLDEVLDYGAEIVVVATGAAWVADGTSGLTHAPVRGAGGAHVVTPEAILAGTAEVGASVLVYDCEGYFMGVGIAELLRSRGAAVTLATPLDPVAPMLDRTWETPVRDRLRGDGVDLRPATELLEIGPTSCRLQHSGRDEELPFDTVVLVTARRSDDALFRALRSSAGLEQAGVEAVYAIGDCVAPRLIGDCIFDGHRLAREIDADDPARPLPYLRERHLVDSKYCLTAD